MPLTLVGPEGQANLAQNFNRIATLSPDTGWKPLHCSSACGAMSQGHSAGGCLRTHGDQETA
jgi:hypothetical protein